MFLSSQKTPATEPPSKPGPIARPERIFLILAALLIVAYELRYVLLPFVVAGALAYVAMPAVGALQQHPGRPRWVGALAVFLLYLCAFSMMGYALARFAVPQVATVMADLPAILHRFFTTLFGGESSHVMGLSLNATQLSQQLAAWRPAGGAGASSGSPWMAAAGIGATVAMGLILTLVLLLYFLLQGPQLARGAVGLVPPAHRPRVLSVAKRAGPLLYRYVTGVFLVVFYTIALTWLFARVWLGLAHAELLAIAVGLLEMVPVAGPILSVMMIALIAIEQLTLGMIVSVAIFATVLRVSIDQFVGPVVLGKATHLPPPVIIFAFLAGGAIYGALGVLVAIPALAIGKIALEEIYSDGIRGDDAA